MTGPRARRRMLALALLAAVTAACSIGEDGAPRDVPEEERGNFGVGAVGGTASGTSRIYLISTPEGEEAILRSVARDVPAEGGDVAAQAEAVLTALLEGPLTTEQLQTAIPADLELLAVRPRGQVLTVDVNDAITALLPEGQTLAVAQIVTTATALDTVERVRLRINGENQEWPTGNGELVTRPLSGYDYPTLIESTQPSFPAIPTRL